MVNEARLRQELEQANLDAVVAVSPENTFYLSGAFIRTQISIRERLALVVWPREGDPTYIVCNIEESLARAEGWVPDVVTYVEFAESPIEKLVEVLDRRGLNRGDQRLGVEERFLTQHYYAELAESCPVSLVRADELMERVRAIKTPGEISRIRDAFRNTEDAIRTAWANSRAGDTEKQVAERMSAEVSRRGADSVRHMTLASGENTIHAHRHPGSRRLQRGDLILTDFGGSWGGFCSDMARMGVVGEPSDIQRDEYQRYRDAYVATLHYLAPGVTAAGVFEFCRTQYQQRGLQLTSPHVGHSLSRNGGHDNPILHPRNPTPLEPNMLIALEPTFSPADDRRYHIEDLVLITTTGREILTDWESTGEMFEIRG
jgi:Xaa-Pro aminopeptidase